MRPLFRAEIEWLDAEELLEELAEDQLALGAQLTALEHAVAARLADPCADIALRSIGERLRDLNSVRDALAAVQHASSSRSVQRAFLPDSPLADYLRSVYAWMLALARAFDALVSGLRGRQPDWASYRWRVEEAKNFHFHELEGAIKKDLLSLEADEDIVDRLMDAIDALLAEARALEARMDQGL